MYDEQEYCIHANILINVANQILATEGKQFVVDEYNKNVLRFLLLYFNKCKLAEEVFPTENYSTEKNIMLIGEPGTGKTLLMRIFAEYLKLVKNSNYYINTSVTQMMNYYKIHGNIDPFTYYQTADKAGFEGLPMNVCANDIGLATERQMSFGTMLSQITDEFMFARYEIYQQHGKMFHITSNLTVKDLKERFDERIIDRFKIFNVIELRGPSRRK